MKTQYCILLIACKGALVESFPCYLSPMDGSMADGTLPLQGQGYMHRYRA